MFNIEKTFLRFLLSLMVFLVKAKFAEPTSFHKIVDNFQSFSSEFEQTYFKSPEASETRPGVQLLNGFGIGYTLANFHENLWNISITGLPFALKTVEKYIADDYGYLVGLFKKNKFKITSTIYSRYSNVTQNLPLSSLSTLMSHLITVDYIRDPAKFVDSFSSGVIASGTKGLLENELLPKGLWKMVFDNSSQGAYLNTMHYKGIYSKSWVDIGQRSFVESNTSFLEVEGEFPLFENDNVTIVIIDLQQQISPKQMIFAKFSNSSKTFPEMLKTVRKLISGPSLEENFIRTRLKVQIPAINITNLSRHNVGLSLIGINDTICMNESTSSSASGRKPDFIQQPLIQANHFELNPEYVEFATATASIVSLNDGGLDFELEEEYHDIESIIVNDEDYSTPFGLSRTSSQIKSLAERNKAVSEIACGALKKMKMKPFTTLPLTYHYQKNFDTIPESQRERRVEDCDEFLEQSQSDSHGSKQDDSLMRTLIFDTPFGVVLRDNTLGEVFSSFVSSLCAYNKVISAIQNNPVTFWLQDVFKVAFSKCY